LAVPLCSLRTHVTQRGCGFIGTECQKPFNLEGVDFNVDYRC
jgi:hypothetical protein